MGHQLAVFKPSPVHWARLSDESVEQRIFMDFIHLGAAQALWQYANTLSVIPNNSSTKAAKETSVATLIVINVTRMVLVQLLDPKASTVFPPAFLDQLSKVESDQQMTDFVRNAFIPLIKKPSELPNVKTDWISFARSQDPMSQVHKYLLKNVSHFVF